MKRICLIILLMLSALAPKAQIEGSDKQAIQMLKEFYSSYSTVKFTLKNLHKLDSLQKKFCTIKVQKELKQELKEMGLDHNLLTVDQGTDVQHLTTLTVEKDIGKANAYVVSYIFPTNDLSNKPIEKKAIIHVTVVKEDGIFKIASVLPNL